MLMLRVSQCMLGCEICRKLQNVSLFILLMNDKIIDKRFCPVKNANYFAECYKKAFNKFVKNNNRYNDLLSDKNIKCLVRLI